MKKASCVIKEKILPLLEEFRKEGRETSPTFKLWDDFITLVLHPFKLFMTVTRSGNWTLYKESQKLMLPVLFAANRTNYCRYMPVVILMYENLPDEVEGSFQMGSFTAKLSLGSFNQVWRLLKRKT